MTVSDDSLLSGARRGDPDALADLLRRHGPGARQSLVGRIPARWQSVLSEDDVMQQTYADAVAAVTGFASEHEGAFAKWLATIAHRNLLDALKMLEAEKHGGNRRRVELGTGDESYVALFEWVTSGGTTPSGHVTRKEAIETMQQAIEHLPETYARVVKLYYLEQQAMEEVARAMGRSPGAVFMLLARARDRLHEIMGSTTRYL